MKLVVEAVETVGTVGNSERNGVDWRVFHRSHSFHSLHYPYHQRADFSASSTERETDCYSWHDLDGRHTLVDAALTRAIPKTPGPLSPRGESPRFIRLFAL